MKATRHARTKRQAPVKTTVRPGLPADLAAVATLAKALWPESALRDHRDHMRAVLSGSPPSTLPLTLFVAECGAGVVGFLEVGLRSHADGCDEQRPVGFVEGWFVASDQRGRGVGRLLMDAAEAWAVAQGCRELASDTWIDNEPSQRAHDALGFEVVDRCVNYRKALRPQRRPAAGRKGSHRPR